MCWFFYSDFHLKNSQPFGRSTSKLQKPQLEALLLHSWIRDLLRYHLSVVPLQAGCQSPLTGCLPNLTHGFARAVTQCSRTRRQTPPHGFMALTNPSLLTAGSLSTTHSTQLLSSGINHRKDFPSCTFI